MHYGREFLSVAMWDSEKAQHLRETCARVRSRRSLSPHLTDSLPLVHNRLLAVGEWVQAERRVTFSFPTFQLS
jgi:hypothetical protein